MRAKRQMCVRASERGGARARRGAARLCVWTALSAGCCSGRHQRRLLSLPTRRPPAVSARRHRIWRSSAGRIAGRRRTRCGGATERGVGTRRLWRRGRGAGLSVTRPAGRRAVLIRAAADYRLLCQLSAAARPVSPRRRTADPAAAARAAARRAAAAHRAPPDEYPMFG